MEHGYNPFFRILANLIRILQDGAILAVCILTLVTAVILLIDFIIMARS